MNEDSDDDAPQLSAHALSALQEFLNEQRSQESEENEKTDGEVKHVSEDWQLSQFWYTEETVSHLAEKTLSMVGSNSKIACISCPTLYKKLKEMLPETVRAMVFEYDKRFLKWGDDFVFYDYNEPELHNLDETLKNNFDVIVCDPPFLTEECISKTFDAAVNMLAKQGVDTPMMFCTGAIMEEHLIKLSQGKLKTTDFSPQHTSKLSNPFVLMSNF